jgi:hypothetical protein
MLHGKKGRLFEVHPHAVKPAFLSEFSLPCHFQHCSSGIYLIFIVDGSPPQASGDDEGGMDPRHKQAGMTKGGWIPATSKRG